MIFSSCSCSHTHNYVHNYIAVYSIHIALCRLARRLANLDSQNRSINTLIHDTTTRCLLLATINWYLPTDDKLRELEIHFTHRIHPANDSSSTEWEDGKLFNPSTTTTCELRKYVRCYSVVTHPRSLPQLIVSHKLSKLLPQYTLKLKHTMTTTATTFASSDARTTDRPSPLSYSY